MTPQKLLAWYEEGRITAMSAVIDLCELAADRDPATFAAEVPAEWLDQLHEMSSRTPPPRTARLVSVCRAGPFDPEEWEAQQKAERERFVAGLKAWKAYFDSADTTG
jgi:hypothetical protein